MDDFEKELKQGFLEEAAESLANVERCFLNLESAKDDPALIEEIFRLAHNLKGSARAVGFTDLGEFTHQLESLLLQIKNKKLELNKGIIDVLLRANDFLRDWIELLRMDMTAKVDWKANGDELVAVTSGNSPVSVTPAAAATEAQPVAEAEPKLSDVPSAADIEAALAVPMPAEGAAPNNTFAGPVSHDAPPPAAPPPRAPARKAAPAAGADDSVRVSVARLEKLINNVGELVILQTVLNQNRHQFMNPLLQKTVGQLAKITKDIQEISMSLRMVPLKSTFQKMQRIVRDTSAALGKTVRLDLSGEESELDKSMAELLGDPLVHMVRNSVDHGVEGTEERLAKGKPAEGVVKLAAYHRGNQIVIEVSDDGRGLDPEKLMQKAREKGILRQDQVLPREEAIRLIFHPGFSTKAEVTEISGRGVGMDVVKTNIEKMLQGEVQLESEVGKGTCVRILLPLTLAIIDGMLLQADTERYMVPLAQVHETVHPKAEDLHFATGMGELLNLRGETLPVHRLTTLMGRRAATQKKNAPIIAIIVRMGDAPFAVLVDDILGQQQTVVKQLGEEVGRLAGVSGGTILGDGRAALIVDLVDLVSRANRKSAPSLRGAA
ncbi:MAG: chemotaxis protein CheA [Bdellovibrionales bacterium]|nr:chemotaxis protein CheA [Bdellovibrionales bacterium]